MIFWIKLGLGRENWLLRPRPLGYVEQLFLFVKKSGNVSTCVDLTDISKGEKEK